MSHEPCVRECHVLRRRPQCAGESQLVSTATMRRAALRTATAWATIRTVLECLMPIAPHVWAATMATLATARRCVCGGVRDGEEDAR